MGVNCLLSRHVDARLAVVLASVWLAYGAFAQAGANRAILVGVNEYGGATLDFCVADAKALGQELLCGGVFREQEVIVMTDDARNFVDRPTAANIADRLENLAQLGEIDTLLVFFAGHGVIGNDGNGYLLTLEGTVKRAIKLDDLKKWMSDCKASERILIMDCCHAGKGVRDLGILPTAKAVAEGIVVVASCSDEQRSFDDSERGHGVFTAFFIEGMRGAADEDHNMQVTLAEAFHYSERNVKSWVYARYNKLQTPVIMPTFGGTRILVGKVRQTAASTTTTTRQRPTTTTATVLVAPTTTMPRLKSETRRITVATPLGYRTCDITFYRNFIGMELVGIPAGEFIMGDSQGEDEVDATWPGGEKTWYRDSHPRHRVTISNAYLIGCTEVTRAQYEQFVKETGYRTDAERVGGCSTIKDGKWQMVDGVNWRNAKFAQEDNHPVVCISWNDANAFCAWLSGKEKAKYRLPTEAEWEYAARAGSTTIWYWGDQEGSATGCANVATAPHWTPAFRNVKDGYQWTSPVARFIPNAWGMHDSIGNVWEWCSDWFGSYVEGTETDPTGPAIGAGRIVRGGSWFSQPALARSALRFVIAPNQSLSSLGFRVVCDGPIR